MELSGAEQLLAEMVRIPSVNPALGGPGETELAGFVEAFLRRTGADVWLQPVTAGRSNVVAALIPKPGPAVLLEAHLDTVAAGDGWHRDPYAGEIEQGKLYGLGACDTKASLASFLAVFATFARDPQRLAQPLIFAATVDEEVGQQGAFALMRAGLDLGGAVTGEPTRCRVVHAHKGFVRFALRTSGRAAHSSRPDEGVNAILRMGAVLRQLEQHAEDLAAGPAHPLLGRPTVNVGTIAGGVGVNTVPDQCTVRIDRRTVPGETLATVRREIEALLRGGPEVRAEEWVERPPLSTPAEAPFVATLVAAARAAGVHAPGPEAVPYLTNAVAYAAAGLPAVVFGPGDIACAHRPDEYVALEQLACASTILERWLERREAQVQQPSR